MKRYVDYSARDRAVALAENLSGTGQLSRADERVALFGTDAERFEAARKAVSSGLDFQSVVMTFGLSGAQEHELKNSVGAMCASSCYDPSLAMSTATLRFDLDTNKGVSGWWVVGGILGGLALGSVVGLVMSAEAVSEMTPDERAKAFGPGGGIHP